MAVTTRFIDHLLIGTHAARPAVAACPAGSLYSCTTHGLVYQNDGAAWSTWATLGGGGSALTVEEVDGTPTDAAVTKIKFPSGTLAITSHEATYTPASGSGLPAGGVSGQMVKVATGGYTERNPAALGSSGNSVYPLVNIHDGDPNTVWGNGGGVIGNWVFYDLGASTSYVISRFRLRQVIGDAGTRASQVIVAGSNDGSAWTNIATVAIPNEIDQTSDFTNTTGYRYYRLTASAATTGYAWWGIGELNLYENVAVAAEWFDTSAYGRSLLDDVDASAALTTLGVSTYAKTLLDDADAAAARTTLGITGTGGGGAVAAGFIGCKAKNAAWSAPSGAWTAASLTSEDWDTDSFHDNSTNPSRITIPAGLGGKYLVVINSEPANSTAGAVRYVEIYKNGLTVASDRDENPSVSSGGFSKARTVTAVLDLVSGDYLQAVIYQDAGSSQNYSISLSAHKLDSGTVGQGIGCRVYNNTTQSVTAGVETNLTLNSEDWDSDAFHSTSVNPERLTIPAGLGGKYLVVAHSFASFAASGGTVKLFSVYRNGNAVAEYRTELSGAATPQVGELVYVMDLAAGDYITFGVYYDGAGPQNFGHASARRVQTEVALVRLDSGVAAAASGATASIGARAVNSGSQSIPSGTWTAVALGGADVFDTDSFHNPASNSSRFTIPAGLGGKYLLTASPGWAASTAGGTRYNAFARNGTRINNMPFGAAAFGGDNGAGVTVTDVVDLLAGDYVEVHVYQDTGGALNLTQAVMSIVKLDSGKVGTGIGAQATNTAGTSITTGVETLIPYATEAFDTDGFHSNVTNNTRLTVPAGLGGKYLVVGTWRSASVGGGNRYSYISKNAIEIHGMVREWGTSTGTAAGQSVAVLDLVPGDYVEFYFAHATGSSITLGTATGENSFSIMRLDSGSSGLTNTRVYTNSIPVMTSATAPSGVASDSEHYATQLAWQAMSPAQQGWLTNASALPHWIGYQYAAAKTAVAYGFRPWYADNFPSRTPTTWLFQGSNDGSSWTTLDSVSGFAPLLSTADYVFNVDLPASYSYYRLYVTANGGNAYTGLGRFEIFTADTAIASVLTIGPTDGGLHGAA